MVWNKDRNEKVVYLSFDDGPTPKITEAVLDMLKEYDAKGTFFLIGKNVTQYPKIADRIISDGHSIGNHTHHHMNGFKNKLGDYLKELKDCEELVDSKLFRPPYGRIKSSQAKAIRELGYSIIMWDVLSADFDTRLTAERCYQNTIKAIENGSIIVFHDSEKAWPRLQECLPRVLKYLKDQDFKMKAIPQPKD